MEQRITKPIEEKKSTEWQTVRLGDVAQILMGQSPPGSTYNELKNGLPFFQGVTDFTYKNPTPRVYCTEPTRIAFPGDILFSVRAPIGRVNIANIECAIGRGLAIVRPRDREDLRYLEFILRSVEDSWHALEGSGSVFGNAKRDDLEGFKIRWPEKNTRNEIASILGSLDDIIELNRQVNETLEQIAQALFKTWFVDFEPFGGEMPSDWREGVLSEVLQSIKQPAKPGEQPGLPYVPIDAIPMRSLALTDFRPNEEAQSSLLTFAKNDILIGAMRVYFHRVSIAPFDGITRTTCFILRPRNSAYFEYLLLLCNEDSTIDFAQSTSKGSTMPYAVWDGGLANLRIAIPPQDVARKFSDMLRPIIERLRDSLFEIRTLNSLRDALLPKLLTGEIRAIDV